MLAKSVAASTAIASVVCFLVVPVQSVAAELAILTTPKSHRCQRLEQGPRDDERSERSVFEGDNGGQERVVDEKEVVKVPSLSLSQSTNLTRR